LADAIVSVEFYLETVQQGRGHHAGMLDNAEACVEALGFPLGYVPASAVEAEIEEADAASESVAEPAAPAPAPVPEPAPVEPKHAVGPRPDEVDPEIVEIFLEESQEEIASLKEHFPHWKKNPEHADSLTTVRRSFHTLKGSGRMVGAELIGEFAWSVENMLNRIIDQTIKATPELFDLIEQAIDALPQLIEQLEAGTAPKADIYGLMERANAISRGEVVPAEEENEVDRKAAAITPEPEPEPEREPEVAADEETMPALVKEVPAEPAAEE